MFHNEKSTSIVPSKGTATTKIYSFHAAIGQTRNHAGSAGQLQNLESTHDSITQGGGGSYQNPTCPVLSGSLAAG